MSDLPPWLAIIIILILVILSAFCSSTETAFACINQFKVKVKADEGNSTAKAILKLYDKYDKTLIMSLLGYNINSVIISTISAFLFFKLFQNSGVSETFVSLISTAVMTIIVFIFCDMVPKMIARAIPERIAANNVYIAYGIYYLLLPLIYLFSFLTNLINKLFKTDDIPTMTEEDFTNVVDDIEEKGFIENNESDIIYNSLEFTDTSVKDVLTKKDKIFYIDMKDLSKEKLNELILSTKYSRIPVVYEGINNVVGILLVKTYIKAYLNNPNVNLVSLLQKPYFADTKIKMDDMIDGFKKNRTHMAIVKNEDKVIGLITMEDVLEELVGKIAEPIEGKSK